MRAYLLALRERGVALGTFKTNQGGIQFLYRRTLERDWPLFWKKRFAPPRQKRLPVVLSDAQIRALLDRVKNPIHKTCLTVMYACGLRIGEATTLEVTAVDGANRVLRIIGKGDKERRVPLPQPVLDDLRSLWRTHRNPRWLFPNHVGTKPVNTACCCAAPSGPPPGLPASRTGSRRMRSGTAMRPGFSKAASIPGSSRSCSATSTSPPPRSTPT